jgi:DNA-binding NtrC family response regulator
VSAAPVILLVEDDDSLRLVLTRELQRAGFTAHSLRDGSGVLAALGKHDPDAVVLDLNLPGTPGLEILAQVVAADPTLPVIVCTGHGSVAVAVQAMQRGAFDFLQKPVELDTLEQTVRRAVAHGRLLRENLRLRAAAAHAAVDALRVAASSPAAQRLDRQVQRVAASDESVLVLGESGVGKELVARRLHAGSRRHDRPFVVVHCGAIPRQLVESELFGHLKGSFTGADHKRQGLFEAADGGTLFLDEVGELPLEVQPALLRAVQFGEIRPVGSDAVRRVDVRIVAATHRDLRAKVADQSFREDLFYRLAVLELHVPPLRERPEDVIPLAEAFLAREATRAGRPLAFDDGAREALRRHDWPGNVRELENAIVRLGVLTDGPIVTARDVAECALGRRAPSPAATLPTLELAELERRAIAQALQRSGGDKTEAARTLGIAVRTLYNKLAAGGDGDKPAD